MGIEKVACAQLNGEEIYVTKELQTYREQIAKYPPRLMMRENELSQTLFGEPDRVELSHDFYAMQLRRRHKTYYWEDEDFQATVNYTYNIDGTVNGNKECSSDNGYVWSITSKDGDFYKTEDLSGVNFTSN